MWIYIPAKVETLNDDNDDLKHGYLVGGGADSGYIALRGTSGVQSDTGWFIVAASNPYPYFLASAMSSADEVVEETEFRRDYGWDTAYCGEPVYTGGGSLGRLFKSFTQNAYIIKYEKGEPCYSLDTLSGTTSGDHFWNTGRDDIGMFWYYDYYTQEVAPTRFEASLAGAVDEYKIGAGDDWISKVVLLPKLDRWVHDPNEGDQTPAGKYINPEDESEIILGVKTYKCNSEPYKDTVWIGHGLKYTSNDRAYYTPDNGRTKLRHRKTFRGDQYGEGWYIGNASQSSTGDYYAYANGSSAIDAKTFTAECYKYNKDTSAFERAASADLNFELGPYQLETEDYSIKMGEVSLWR